MYSSCDDLQIIQFVSCPKIWECF